MLKDPALPSNKNQGLIDTLSFSIILDSYSYLPGESIKVECQFKNNSGTPIYLYPVMEINPYLVRKDGKATDFRLNAIISYKTVGRDQLIRIEPGEFYTRSFLVMEPIYHMPRENGYYFLNLEFINKLGQFEDIPLWVGRVKSNAIKFMIKTD